MTRRQAYRTLGLEVGASFAEVEEAFAELHAVWDPTRFEDDPKLKEKAKRKRTEIEAALELIQQLSSSAADSRQDLYKAIYGPGSARDKEPARFKEPEDDGRPSLLSDTFSSKRHRKKSTVPLWAIGGGAFVLIIVIIVLSRPGSETQSPVIPVQAPLPEVVEPITGGAPVRQQQPDPPPAAVTPPPPREQTRTPPPTARPTVSRTPVAPPPSEAPKPSGPRPELLRGEEARTEPDSETTTGVPGSTADPGTESPEAVRPEMEPEVQEAFEILKNDSEAALKLVGGLVEGLTYKEWRLAGRRGGALLIDIIAINAEGKELHLVWGVDKGLARIRALSQAARDLESRLALAPSS